MSEENISRSAVEISIGEKSLEYTKVVVIDKDGKEYSAGTDSGNTLTANCPWATQDMANSILLKFNGKIYQSFTARDAYISPDIELGGKINVVGVSSVILKQNTEFGDLMTSTVSAPGEEELEHEFEYVSRVDRERIRQSRYFSGALEKVSNNAEEGILEAHKELVAALNREDGAPKDLLAGFDSYVRWDLTNNEGFAASQLFAQIGEKARAEIGVYAVEADGETRTFAQILADQITLESAVEDAFVELELKANSKTVEALDGTVKTMQSTQAELTTRVGNAESSLLQKVSVTEFDDALAAEQEAITELSTQIDGVQSSLTLKANTSTVEAIAGRVNTVETAQANLTTRVGNAESALTQKVSVTEFDEALAAEQQAITELSSQVDGAEARITLNAQNISGVASSVATIQADVVNLKGKVKIDGTVKVENGVFKAEDISCNGDVDADGSIYAQGGLGCQTGPLRIGGRQFDPIEITSTSGPVLVLGVA